jgi:ribonuclease P protein component
MFEFPKKQRLSNEKEIERLFLKNNSFEESPFRIVWKFEENNNKVAIKSLIVVPKKRLNLASERNKVKRIIRDVFRKNKLTLEHYLKESKKQINLAIIYQQEEILDYTIIEEKIKVLLGRLKESL